MSVASSILGFFVTVIGWAIVTGALVLAVILLALHVAWYAERAWAALMRRVDILSWWPK